MPDQYGTITGQDWLGMVGAVSNIDSMRRGREYLGMQRAEEARAATRFGQEQKDRQTAEKAMDEVASAWHQSGGIDQYGQLTDKGYELLANPQASDKKNVVNSLKEKGKDAFAYLEATTKFTGNILSNEVNKKNLQTLALDKANQNYEKIEGLLKAAQVENGRGEPSKAAQYIASAIGDSGMRKHAKAVDDKIEIWEVVNGVKQPSDTLTVEEALMAAKDYTRKNYIQQSAAHIVTGFEGNKEPKIFDLITPKGEKVKAVQIFKSNGVDYHFFKPDGSVMEGAPDNLEQAYENGFLPAGDEKAVAELEKIKAETASKKATTTKTIEETKYVGKDKEDKPLTPDKAREKLLDIAKFKSGLNKTGGWQETTFELMAQKDPKFAERALSINSSKKEVNDTIKELEAYYKSFLPEGEKPGKDIKIDTERQNALAAIKQGASPDKVKIMYKQRTGKDLEL